MNTASQQTEIRIHKTTKKSSHLPMSHIIIAWKVYICVLVLLHANRSGRKFYKSVSEPLKK